MNVRLRLNRKDILTGLTVYGLMALFYWYALLITSSYQFNSWGQTLVNYSLKALFSVPVFWLVFIRFHSWPLRLRLLLDLICLPVYLVAYIYTYYAACEWLNLGHLVYPGNFWDVYISTLIYMIQFGVLHLYEFYQRVLAQQQTEAALMQAKSEAEHNVLKAQIQPHFLFNTLNSINASMPPQMEHSRQLIARLADTFRYALQSSRQERVTLAEEIEFLTDLMTLEKERLGQRLRFTLDIEPALMDIQLAPMLLQPLLENAIRHGIGPLLDGGEVTLSAQQNAGRIDFTLTNTAPATDDPKGRGTGVGLFNVSRRLEAIYSTQLCYHREADRVTVSFSIPLEKV